MLMKNQIQMKKALKAGFGGGVTCRSSCSKVQGSSFGRQKRSLVGNYILTSQNTNITVF